MLKMFKKLTAAAIEKSALFGVFDEGGVYQVLLVSPPNGEIDEDASKRVSDALKALAAGKPSPYFNLFHLYESGQAVAEISGSELPNDGAIYDAINSAVQKLIESRYKEIFRRG